MFQNGLYYPNAAERNQLSTSLGVEVQSVNRWFERQRDRERKHCSKCIDELRQNLRADTAQPDEERSDLLLAKIAGHEATLERLQANAARKEAVAATAANALVGTAVATDFEPVVRKYLCARVLKRGMKRGQTTSTTFPPTTAPKTKL